MSSERFKLEVSPGSKYDQYCIIDTEQEVLTIYNDLGFIHFTSAPAVCELLNEQDTRIKELEAREEKLYAYFREWFEEERGTNPYDFAEMWQAIATGETDDDDEEDY